MIDPVIYGISGERVELRRQPSNAYVDYGDWTADEQGDWFVPAALGGSDYSGGFVNRSNFEWFEEHYDDDAASFFYYLEGGHGTYGVVLYIPTTPAAVWDALERAERYPSIDDRRLSDMEHEAKEQAWDGWVSLEFQGELASHLVRARGFQIEEASDVADEIDDGGRLRDLFEVCREKANVEWRPDGETRQMTVDLKKAADGCGWLTIEELKAGALREEDERRRGREHLRRHVERLREGARTEPAPARAPETPIEEIAQRPAGELTGAEIARLQRYWGYPEHPPPRYDPSLPPAAQRPRFDWARMSDEEQAYWRSLGYEPPSAERLRQRIAEHRRRGLVEGLHYNRRR